MAQSDDLAQIVKEFQHAFPERKKSAHKGEFGRVFILAGSRGLCGAGLLAAIGALRSGAGLTSLATPNECSGMILTKIPEVMIKPLAETEEGSVSQAAYPEIQRYLSGQNVFALGPGLSQNQETQGLIRQLVRESKIPLVIDADGLNAFSDHRNELKNLNAPAVITPHPGEFARLFGAPVSDSESDRKKAALEKAKEFGVIVVLKGAGTVVATPKAEVYVNPTGNPGMAKAGSGDILLGIIASFLAQGFPPFEAAKYGVFIHGFAGDLTAKDFDEVSMTPGDMLNYLPQAFLMLLGK